MGTLVTLGCPWAMGAVGAWGCQGTACLVGGSWGTLGCCEALRWLLLLGAAPRPPQGPSTSLPSPSMASRTPLHLPAGSPPVMSLQRGRCTGRLQLPHPWVWVVLNPSHGPPAQLSPVPLGAPPALPCGSPGTRPLPRAPRGGRFCKENQRLGFRNNLFFFFSFSQSKVQFGFISAGERLAPAPGVPAPAGLWLGKRREFKPKIRTKIASQGNSYFCHLFFNLISSEKTAALPAAPEGTRESGAHGVTVPPEPCG